MSASSSERSPLSSAAPYDVSRLPLRVSPPPHRTFPVPPKYRLPFGACDGHVHIFGPQRRFPLVTEGPHMPGQGIVFEDSTLEDLVAMLDAVGLTRAVYVQTMMYGHRYDTMIHALTRQPDRLRGVIIADAEMTDGELRLLDSAGVIGARMASTFEARLDERLIARVSDMGWSVHYLAKDWSAWRDKVLATPGKFIIEHMGQVDAREGLSSPNMRFLLDALDTGRCWVKLSPRLSNEQDLPFADVLPIVHRLVEHAPNRLLWGSDWPHPVYFGRPVPSEVGLIDLMLQWVPDPVVRDRIMVDNAVEAYGWKL